MNRLCFILSKIELVNGFQVPARSDIIFHKKFGIQAAIVQITRQQYVPVSRACNGFRSEGPVTKQNGTGRAADGKSQEIDI